MPIHVPTVFVLILHPWLPLTRQGGSDGAEPFAGLIAFAGALRGTTGSGGADRKPTVIVLKP
jgi:hypothetical protein